MLQRMRDMSKSWIFKSLMVLLIVSFGIWGVGDMFRGNPLQKTVAKVGEKKISVQELEQQFRLDLPDARQSMGEELNEAQARQMGVMDRSLKILIEYALFDQESRRLGVNVSDKVILDRIASYPQFRDKDGNFNAHLWRQALGKNNLSESLFLDSERRDTARKLVLGVLKNPGALPETMLDNLTRAYGSKRILEIVTLRNDSIRNVPKPGDAALKQYYEERASAMFMAPEYRALTIIVLNASDIAKDIGINDEDLKNAYEARAAEFALPEQRDLVQVVVDDESKAKAIADAAQANNNLSAAAKANGANVIALDRMNENSTLPELFTTIFAMEEGQVSDPVKSGMGWHVLQLKKVHPSSQPPFDEVKARLLETLKSEQSADTLTRAINKLDDDLAGGKSLEDIADAMSLRLIKIPALDGNALTPEGKEPNELPAREDVVKNAFSQEAGDSSAIIDDGKGHYIVVRTDNVTPSQLRPFESVKDKVLAAWEAEQKAQEAARAAEKIAQSMREGKNATSLAAQPGVEVRLSKPVSLLGEMDREVPMETLPAILKMKKGDVITANTPGKQFVLRLADVIAADPAKDGGAKLKLADALRERVPYELIDQYSQFLRLRYPVRINLELFDLIKKQGS